MDSTIDPVARPRLQRDRLALDTDPPRAGSGGRVGAGGMTSRERVLAAVRGEVVDRPPFAVWRHFYDREDSGARPLAEALVAWVWKFRLDLLKYNPRAHYHAEPWGTRYAYQGDARPELVRYAVQDAEGWRRIRPVPPTEGVFAEMLKGIGLARQAVLDVPLVMTIFTPLAVCERLAGRERLLEDLRGRPDDLLGALEALAETYAGFAAACLEAGADGIFLATTAWAQRDVLSDEEYARFGRPFDLSVLDPAAGAPLNILHVCGANARVLELADYPVAAVSWNVHLSGNPGLIDFRSRWSNRAAVGGLSDDALTANDGARARVEVARGLAETGGRGWIAAGGCTIPTHSTVRAIAAARDALAEAASAR